MRFLLLKKEYVYSPYFIMFVWFCALLLTKPFANTFVNDDWVYAHSVKYLLDTGHFRLDDYCGSSILAQVLWGTLFCVFGFSATALKVSTVVLSLAGILFIFKTAKILSKSIEVSFWVTVVSVFNPMYLSLSATFMTDIPFLAFSIISLYMYLRASATGKMWYFAPATFFAIAAVLTRQSGLILPLCAILLFVNPRKWRWKYLVTSVLAFAAVCWSYKLFTGYIIHSQGHLPSFFSNTGRLYANIDFSLGFVIEKINLLGAILLYVGLLSIPFVPFIFSRSMVMTRGQIIAVMIVVILGVAGFDAMLLHNTINDFYVGPQVLKDARYLGYKHDISLSPLLMLLLRCAAFASLLIVATHIARQFKAWTSESLFLLFFSVAFMAAHTFSISVFDRYFILSNTVVMIACSPLVHLSRTRKVLAAASFVTLAILSVIMVHDYFSCNRAQFRAANTLVGNGLKPHQIDAGYEFDGWYNYSDTFDLKKGKSWWWVIDDEYLVCFSKIKGTEEVGVEPYTRWLDLSKQNLHILKKIDAEQAHVKPLLNFDPRKPHDSIPDKEAGAQVFLHNDSMRTEMRTENSGRRTYVFDSTRLYGFSYELLSCKLTQYAQIHGLVAIHDPEKFPDIVIANEDTYMRFKPELTHVKSNWYTLQFDFYMPETKFSNVTFYLWNVNKQQVLIDNLKVYRINE